MFRWDDMRVLLALHRGGSLAEAGRRIGVDASTASRRLRALEDALGKPLAARTSDGLRLTDLAVRLLNHAEQVEAVALAVEAEVAGEEVDPVGTVTVACADAFGVYVLAPQLPHFFERNPGIRIDLLVSTALVDLSRREADIAIRFVRPTFGDLVAQRVSTSGSYTGFMSPAYAKDRADLSFQAVDWIGWGASRAHLDEAQLYQRLVGKPPRFTCDNLVVMVEACRAGVGALLLPSSVGEVYPDLVEVQGLPSRSSQLSTWVVTHAVLRDVPRVRRVRNWLVELVRGTTAEQREALDGAAG